MECQNFTAMEEQGERAYFDQYNGRIGNFPPDDGYNFRGRGLIQLTGRDNYAYYGPLVFCDLVTQPDMAAEPRIALLIAGEFWKRLALNDLADEDDIIDVTHRINGGLNGIEQRRAYLARAKPVLAQMTGGRHRERPRRRRSPPRGQRSNATPWQAIICAWRYNGS